MWLITVYVGLVLVGDAIDCFVGLAVERYWPEASIFVFIFLYLGCLWLAWALAVRWTTPKIETATAGATSTGQ